MHHVSGLSIFIRAARGLLAGLFFLLSCLAPLAALAADAKNSVASGKGNWQALVYDTALPKRMVAVDKARQIFHLFEKQSPLSLTFTYPCTTGQAEGDKQVTNDLRTPEGVYFVEYKIAQGLDFKEYGGIAYTLNYPNPVDRLRGKTGHGIWLHSKGFGIVPRDTRGCIAIGLREMDEVGPLLLPGTPVVVAEHIPTDTLPVRDDGTARHLRTRMDQWTRAWASRSSKLFDYYDTEAYTRAMPESFTAFRANKERLFKRFAWINIFNREIHVLEGPGYWVTWSEQFYRAPNLSTEGIRRLYWQRDTNNHFRVVGMEWLPRNLGMQVAYEKGQLVAAVEAPLSDARHAEAPLPPPLSMPEAPDIPLSPLVPPTAPAMPAQAPTAPPPQTLAQKLPQTLDAGTALALAARMEAWRTAWQQRNLEIFSFYDQQRYGTLKDISPQDTFRALKADMVRRFRAPWIDVLQRPATVHAGGPYAVTSAAQWLREPGRRAPVQGMRTLYWQRTGDQEPFLIVASRWVPGDQGMETDYLESITAPVIAAIDAWRATWERGHLDDYMNYYGPQARQQGKGKGAIREHKARLWATAPPAQVTLSGLRVLTDPEGVRVDMAQEYRDRTGRGDKGTKTLVLYPTPEGWRILREDWTAPVPLQGLGS